MERLATLLAEAQRTFDQTYPVPALGPIEASRLGSDLSAARMRAQRLLEVLSFWIPAPGGRSGSYRLNNLSAPDCQSFRPPAGSDVPVPGANTRVRLLRSCATPGRPA